jgi:predicted nucleic acid-binding protein
MKVLIDLNVLLDVIQRREPHYRPAARVLSLVAEGMIEAVVPGHALTTVHYIVSRFTDAGTADAAINWILTDFEVIGEGTDVMLRARSLASDDFEDAVVAAAAQTASCDWIITRNVVDFAESPVPAITPAELLERFANT